MELEHHISHEAPRSAILSSAAGTNVLSLHTFLEILSGNGPEYDSDDIDYYSPSLMCFHIDGDNPIVDAPELTPPNQSPRNHAAYLHEKATSFR